MQASHFWSNKKATDNQVRLSPPPILGLFLIWLLACFIALIGLGDLPLRDFDEGTVARVAFELSQKGNLKEQVLPTIWDSDYLNKPPGLHFLIAQTINLHHSFKGANNIDYPPPEFLIRLVPALLSTLVVPLGGLIQWQLRPNDRLCCITTSGILLTLMPIARHGRLAMLDGTQLSAISLLWLFLLTINRSHLDRLKALGAGLSGSCMLLLKAPLLIPAALAALIPMFAEKRFKQYWSWQLSLWLGLGLMPGLSWHLWHGINRGTGALWLWGGDGAVRVLFTVGEGSDLGWRVPLIELIEGGWPWILLLPFAIAWAWKERKHSWGQWALGTQSILALSILPLKTQLPWYSHPLWLPFSLLCGVPLAWLIRRTGSEHPPGSKLLKLIPNLWLILGIAFLQIAALGITGIISQLRAYSTIALLTGTGWLIGGWLLRHPKESKRKIGAISLVAGNLVALILLMNSPLWIWELNENWPVKPVAQLSNTTMSSQIFIDGSDERPSLNWYSGKKISRLKNLSGANWILTRDPELIRQAAKKQSRECKPIEKKVNWTLMSCSPKNN